MTRWYTYAMDIKSPFPGLDPYLEKHWSDVHHSLIQYSRDALQGILPDDLVSRVEERVYVESDKARVRQIVPDTHIVEWKPNRGAATAAGGGMALAEAGVAATESRFFILEDDPTTEGFIEIRDADGGQLVTVIEFLSPSNKLSPEGRQTYLDKRREGRSAGSSLVEIDLKTGAFQRSIQLPQPLGIRAASGANERLLYQVARHSNV